MKVVYKFIESGNFHICKAGTFTYESFLFGYQRDLTVKLISKENIRIFIMSLKYLNLFVL
jgi:hypothetical protein